MKYEFPQLFQALFHNAERYMAIIRELANKKGGMTRAELIGSGKAAEGKELTRCLDLYVDFLIFPWRRMAAIFSLWIHTVCFI